MEQVPSTTRARTDPPVIGSLFPGVPLVHDALAGTRSRLADAWRTNQGAPIDALAAALTSALTHRRGEGAYLSAWRSYAEACAARGASPTPITANNLIVWSTGYVGKGRSSASLPTLIGRLRSYAANQHIVCDPDAFMTARTYVDGLRTAVPSPATRRAPELTYDGLARLFAHHRPLVTTDAVALQVCAMAVLGWSSGMRACEYVEGRLAAQHVHLHAPTREHPGGVTITAILPKATKRSLEPTRYAVLDTPTGPTPLVAVLSRWAEVRGLRLGDTADGSEVFPRLRDGTTVHDAAAGTITGRHTTTSWTNLLRSHLTAAGVPEGAAVTGHSLRAARRTELAREGAPVSLVHAAVGWSSTASEAYDRRRPDELLAALAASHRCPVTETGGTRASPRDA